MMRAAGQVFAYVHKGLWPDLPRMAPRLNFFDENKRFTLDPSPRQDRTESWDEASTPAFTGREAVSSPPGPAFPRRTDAARPDTRLQAPVRAAGAIYNQGHKKRDGVRHGRVRPEQAVDAG